MEPRERIRKAREEQGLSRDALAKRAGLTAMTIYRVERGETASAGSIALIFHALGLPIDDLIHEDHGSPASGARVKSEDGPGTSKNRAAHTTTQGA